MTTIFLSADAACTQYIRDHCGTELPFTGLSVWPIVAMGILLLVAGLCIRTVLDRNR